MSFEQNPFPFTMAILTSPQLNPFLPANAWTPPHDAADKVWGAYRQAQFPAAYLFFSQLAPFAPFSRIWGYVVGQQVMGVMSALDAMRRAAPFMMAPPFIPFASHTICAPHTHFSPYGAHPAAMVL